MGLQFIWSVKTMMLTYKSKSKSKTVKKQKSISVISLAFVLSIFPGLAFAAPTFTANTTKVDLAQPGLQEMLSFDFNQDGFMDVILSDYDGRLDGSKIPVIEIHFADSAGVYGNKKTLKVENGTPVGLSFTPAGIAVADVNGDNVLDVAITDGSGNTGFPYSTYIYHGRITPNGAIKEYDLFLVSNPTIISTSGIPHSVVFGFFDSDNFVDIVIAHKLGISLFLGAAGGTFSAMAIEVSKTTSLNANKELFAAHMNNDTFLDIVTDKEILFNNNNLANPTVANPAFTRNLNYGVVNSTIGAVTVADFNNDTIADLAYAVNFSARTGISSKLVVRESTVSGTNITYVIKETPIILNSKIIDMTTGDIDLDGKVDVFLLDQNQDAVILYTGNGNGTFATSTTIPIIAPNRVQPPLNPAVFVATLSNNDRLLDFVIGNEVDFQNPSLTTLIQNDLGKEQIIFDSLNISTPKPAVGATQTLLPIGVSRKYIPAPPGAVTVSYTVIDGTAVNGVDFSAPSGITNLPFAANSKSETININILPVASTDTSRQFTIKLTDSAGLVSANEVVTISINNSAVELPLISFKLSNFERNEDPNLTNVLVTAVRTLPQTFQLSGNTTTTVHLSTQNLTSTAANTDPAIPNDDYTPIPANLAAPNLVFTGTQTEAQLIIPIEIIDDNAVERTEQFGVVLNKPVNGVLALNNITATVTILDNDTAAPVNSLPIANRDTYIAKKNVDLVIDLQSGLLKNDTDADIPNQVDIFTTLKVRLDPTTPLADLILNKDGSFTFLKQSTAGTHTFKYIVNDGTDDSAISGDVTINVFNNRPIANDDVYRIPKNTILNLVNVLDNDSDDDNDSLTIQSPLVVSSSVPGLTLASDGSVTFEHPDPTFVGDVIFEYTISDGIDTSLPATVTITVYALTQVDSGVFSFDTKNTYTVSEESEEIILNVVRNSGSKGTVILSYVIKDNTAINGTDFDDITSSPLTKKLTFADGDTMMPITIEIKTDEEIESPEDFLISLTTVNAGVLANSNTSKLVTITDSTQPIEPNSNVQNTGTDIAPNSGGGCTLQATSRFDPLFPVLMMLALFYFGRRVKFNIK